jgi:hypothetical protein
MAIDDANLEERYRKQNIEPSLAFHESMRSKPGCFKPRHDEKPRRSKWRVRVAGLRASAQGIYHGQDDQEPVD